MEEVVVTPSHDKTFGDLYLDIDDLKRNPQKGIEPQLAGMMIDVLKASGHLDETTPVKDVKTPSFKKGIIFGLPKPMPPPPPLMSKNTSTLQHSTTNQMCWKGAWFREKRFKVECPNGHVDCTANLHRAAPLSGCVVLHSLGYEIAAIAAKKSEPSYGFDSPKERTATSAVYLLLGQIPVEAELHKRMLNFFGNIIRNHGSDERDVAIRQLAVMPRDSNSWFVKIVELTEQYGLPSPLDVPP
ncbi:unnamed protein product [Mytilus coruscus]|uniref:Uncharacterized protein n=1 Tax=Mytilus coruscus TaxID=42192 RepID=A0A6J8EQ08_MYTCO|nr:unnamed protein product [Mytilus coruscus]